MPYRLEKIELWISAREAQRRPDDELLEVVEILVDYSAGQMAAPNGFWIAHCAELLTGCRSVPIQVDRSRQEDVPKNWLGVRDG